VADKTNKVILILILQLWLLFCSQAFGRSGLTPLRILCNQAEIIAIGKFDSITAGEQISKLNGKPDILYAEFHIATLLKGNNENINLRCVTFPGLVCPEQAPILSEKKVLVFLSKFQNDTTSYYICGDRLGAKYLDTLVLQVYENKIREYLNFPQSSTIGDSLITNWLVSLAIDTLTRFDGAVDLAGGWDGADKLSDPQKRLIYDSILNSKKLGHFDFVLLSMLDLYVDRRILPLLLDYIQRDYMYINHWAFYSMEKISIFMDLREGKDLVEELNKIKNKVDGYSQRDSILVEFRKLVQAK
jgi:hypothetical protein